jgi:hypothetical protein
VAEKQMKKKQQNSIKSKSASYSKYQNITPGNKTLLKTTHKLPSLATPQTNKIQCHY